MTDTTLRDGGTSTFASHNEWHQGRASNNEVRVRYARHPTHPPLPVFDVEAVYRWVQAGEYDKALDLIFEHFDAAFSRGEFAIVDRVLQSVVLARLDDHTAFGLLSATYPAKGSLASRPRLVDAVGERLRSVGRTEREVESLLRGVR